MRRLVALLGCLVLVAGCAGYGSPGEDIGANGVASALKYVHDDKHAVSCWYVVGSSGGSLSCLPDASVTLP